MDVCTIIAKNYAAHARVLARSFSAHHPDGRIFVLVIDDADGYLEPESEPFEILSPGDIGCDDFQDMAARYDVLELSTAVKPWLLRHLLTAGSPSITYLDPDIQVFASLEPLEELSIERKLVLTPHNTVPIPFDGERPSQIDIMSAGVFNLGYISLGAGAQTDELLDWWSDRLRRDCRVDPVYGYFVDQRWMDLVPGLLPDLAIIREPEFNLAYWNLHSRELEHDGERYTVDGRPLTFFHFSGFDPDMRHSLSRHQTRIKLEEHPTLCRICSDYADALESDGYAVARTWPYDWERLADGTRFSRMLRRLYADGEDRGELHRAPFDEPGSQAFVTWLTGQEADAPQGITRVLADIYEQRVDLQKAFPDVAGAHRLDYLEWVSRRGTLELDLPESLLPESRESPPPAAATSPAQPAALPESPREPLFGVNVVGYFRSELGVGEAGRQVVSALDAVEVPVLPLHGRTIPLSRQGHPFTYLDHSNARYPTNLVCMNADALPDFARQAGASFFADRYTIGLWFWEVTSPPASQWADAFALVDEVWAATHHVAQAISAVSPVPVVRIPLPVEFPPVPGDAREYFGFSEDEFVFLFSFDYLSVFERKNPLAVVSAFTQAFDSDSGARLVLKCINAEHDPVHRDELQRVVSDRGDIRLLDQYLAPEAKNALTSAADCYVSLHRSEGFGLTMAEAMFYGKPVIATGYSGNVDFMTPWNSYLVDYDLVPIGAGAAPYPADGLWAEPSVEHAAQVMRTVFDDRDQARERGRRAAVDILSTNSPVVCGQAMAARLRHTPTHSRASSPPEARAVVSPALPSITGLADQIRRGPEAASPGSAMRAALRRAVLRIMKPFTAHQMIVNAQILDALRDVQRALVETNAECFTAVAEVEHRVTGVDLKLDGVGADQVRTESTYLRDARLQARERRGVVEQIGDLAARSGELARRSDGFSWALERINAETHAIPFMQGAPFTTMADPEAGIVLGYSYADGASESEQYRSFEDVFRGSEEFIRERQRKYLPIIGSRRPVFDFGCGRGELLDLLRVAEIPFIAVDVDPGMVARCHDKGHASVVQGDGLEVLEDQADGTLGVVFTAQVIEHMTEDQIRRLLSLSLRKLADDGLLIAETVNPHSHPALKTFWVDLSHQQPIFPEVALELCRETGFASAYYFHPNGTGDVERDRFAEGEFAVVARAGVGASLAPAGANTDGSE